MLFEIIPSTDYLEIRFNGDGSLCQFHKFQRSENITLFNMPKCASTSLIKYFKFLCGQKLKGHRTLLFVREPYARLKSTFKMVCSNDPRSENFDSTIAKYHAFLRGERIPYDHYNDMIHFIPQTSLIDSVNIKFDHVHRIENLQQAIDGLNSALNVKDYKVEHSNKSILSQQQNGQFEEAYTKNFEMNKIFYTGFLEKDVKLYDICD